MPTQMHPDVPADVDEEMSCTCAFQDRYDNLTQTVEDFTIIGCPMAMF